MKQTVSSPRRLELPRNAAEWLEAIMNFLFFLCGILAVGCVVLISAYMVISGVPAIRQIGLFRFLFGTEWASTAADPKFGILPFLLSSIYGTLGATLIGVPVGLLTAVFLSKAAGPRVRAVVVTAIELLSGIPSVVFGLLGMQVLVPAVAQTFGKASGACLLSAIVVLSIMILPTIIRTTQESLKTVPQGYREGALGLGAGKWHIIRTIVLPCSVDGIVTGCILAVGRIVGESAALLFTAGAAEVIAQNVVKAYTSNGATLSVLLYLRAFEDGDFDSAWAIGAVLLVLVLAINLAARLAKTKLKQKQ